jgi:hypothetical protein
LICDSIEPIKITVKTIMNIGEGTQSSKEEFSNLHINEATGIYIGLTFLKLTRKQIGNAEEILS